LSDTLDFVSIVALLMGISFVLLGAFLVSFVSVPLGYSMLAVGLAEIFISIVLMLGTLAFDKIKQLGFLGEHDQIKVRVLASKAWTEPKPSVH